MAFTSLHHPPHHIPSSRPAVRLSYVVCRLRGSHFSMSGHIDAGGFSGFVGFCVDKFYIVRLMKEMLIILVSFVLYEPRSHFPLTTSLLDSGHISSSQAEAKGSTVLR